VVDWRKEEMWLLLRRRWGSDGWAMQFAWTDGGDLCLGKGDFLVGYCVILIKFKYLLWCYNL
jgi:hypothetical protein